MKTFHTLTSLLAIVAFCGAVSVAGCNNIAPAVRKVTYPPDFRYVSGQELRSSMDQLAYQLQLLDSTLTQDGTRPTIQQQRVLTALNNIERIGAELQTGEAGSTHPFLNDFMRDFRTGVRQALDAASMTPPDYYPAGKIAGGCVNCHKVNR